MKKILLYFVIICSLIIAPLGVEYLIANGIFGYTFPNSIFENSEWFAFWGSYLGSIITVIVLFITIRYNKKEMERALKDYEIESTYDELLRKLHQIHSYINLEDFSGNKVDDAYIIYSLKLSDKRMFHMMNEYEEKSRKFDNGYIEIVKQIFYEYLVEADKVPKTVDVSEMPAVAATYMECVKNIKSIMHKYVQKEAIAYDELVEIVGKVKMEEKRNNISDFY